jgi:transcriptional regulator with XRE-family HTH domain
MAIVNAQPGVGSLLREWRERRRLTQLELAIETGISTRHLSFVETGRSKPGREILLRVAERLEIPLREQNELLLVAGHAPAFPERSLEDPELAPVRQALDRILIAHEPYPAIVFDRAWNLVAANAGVLPLIEGVEPGLLEPPINVVRVGLAMAPRIANPGQVLAFIRERLQRQVTITGDKDLAALLDQLATYLDAEHDPDLARDSRAGDFLGPVRLGRPDDGELSFFGMFATFDTPFEVTTSELAMELLFPADGATAEALENRSRQLPADAPIKGGTPLWM